MDSGRDEAGPRAGFAIPVGWVALGVAALVVIGAAFYGGMAYEKQRAEAELATVSDLRDAQRPTGEQPTAEPIELEIDKSVEVEGPDGDLMVTLHSVGLTEDYSQGRAQRLIELVVTVEKLTGDQVLLTSLEGHFEDNLGKTREHVVTTCIEDMPLPSLPVAAGEAVRGCEAMIIPDGAGRIVLDRFAPELYVEVPAA